MTISRNLGNLAQGVDASGFLQPSRGGSPTITSLSYSGNDSAVDPTSPLPVTLTGANFVSGAVVYVNTVAATNSGTAIVFNSSTSITFTPPTGLSPNNYNVWIVNPNGTMAVLVNGLLYSNNPSWASQNTSLTVTGTEVNIQLAATGDSPFVYSLVSGTLPTSTTLSANGLISGTYSGDSATFPNIVINAADAQNQDANVTIQIAITVSTPNQNLVTLLLNGDGANGGQNNTFVDSSNNNFTITRNGNTTQGSFSPYGDLWSNYFDGAGDYLSVASNAAFGYGTGDFEISFWFYKTNSGDAFLIDQRTTDTQAAVCLYITSSTVRLYVSGADRITSSSISLNTWYYLTVSRVSGTTKMFLNGSQTGSDYSDSTNYVNSPVIIGIRAIDLSSSPLQGYVSNTRIVKGNGITSQTVPTVPLTAVSGTSLLTCQSNRFIDNSSNAFAITVAGNTSVQRFSPFEPSAPYSTSVIGGSGYFDGSGDFLNLTDTSNVLDLGNATASFECWAYPTAFPSQNMIIMKGNSNSYNTTDGIEYTLTFASGVITFYYNSSGSGSTLTDSVGRRLNEWYHIAVATNSTTISLFVNGTRVATTTAGITKPTTRTAVRLGNSQAGEVFNGYLSNIRHISGANAYSASATTITVPTVPLTAVSGTQLLNTFANASIFDYAMINNLETVGNAQISTSVKKYGTGSLAFDGNGDYLLLPNSKPLTIYSSSPFTIEFWVYFNSVSAQQYILSNWTIGSDGYAIATGVSTFANNQIAFFDGTSWRGGSTTVTTGTWYHFAVSSSGASSGTYIYLNGTSQVSGFTCAGTIDNAATQMFIGLAGSGATSFLNGYIDDLRITNGVNRYPGGTAFTPPTAALPTF